MTKAIRKSQTSSHVNSIIGVRMSEKMAKAVKKEAASKGVTIKKLFEEMWRTYKQKDNS